MYGEECKRFYDEVIKQEKDKPLSNGGKELSQLLSRLGDPKVLCEIDTLSKIFYIPDKSILEKYRVNTKIPLAWGTMLNREDDQKTLAILRAATILVCSSMGIIIEESTCVVAHNDDQERDYGYGAGRAVISRAAWVGAGYHDKEFQRAMCVGTILVSLATRGMASWAVEIAAFLTQEALGLRAPRCVGTGLGEVSVAIREARPRDDYAPMYASYLAVCQKYIDELPSLIKRNEKECTKEDGFLCNCGLPWAFVPFMDANKKKGLYCLCPIRVITNKGCEKWSIVKIT
jgi:hypothetical protein